MIVVLGYPAAGSLLESCRRVRVREGNMADTEIGVMRFEDGRGVIAQEYR